MNDYKIVAQNGEYMIIGQTERAEKRTPGNIKIGHALVLKGREDTDDYIKAGEAAGFTFEKKEFIAA